MGLRINPQGGSDILPKNDSDVKTISDELRRAIDAINCTDSPLNKPLRRVVDEINCTHSPQPKPLAVDTRELYTSVSDKISEITSRISSDTDLKIFKNINWYLDMIIDILPLKSECRFIEVDGRGTYRYTLGYGKAVANYDIAPEFLKGFKEMAYHFIKDVEQKKPISFLTDNSLILKQGNMLTADEACK